MRSESSTGEAPVAKAYFYAADGSPSRSHILVNKPLADTLRTIAKSGPDAFYTGDIAREHRAPRFAVPLTPAT